VRIGRTGEFSVLTLAAAAAAYAAASLNPLQEALRTALALTDNRIAMLQGPALATALVLAAVPLGIAIDRYSRVRLLLLFAVSELLGTILTAVATDFAVLFLARCLIGLTATATSVAVFSLLADLYPEERRGRASMVVVVGQFAGTAAAFAGGGALLSAYTPAPEGWRWAMGFMALPLLPIGVALKVLREPPRTGVASLRPSSRDLAREVWRYRAFVGPLLSGLVLIEIAFRAVLVWAAPVLSRGFELSAARVGAILSTVVLVSGVLGSICGGVLADLCQRGGGARRTITALSTLTLLSAPTGLFGIAQGLATSSLLLVSFMTIISAMLVVAVVLLTVALPNELRGVCLSASAAANVLFGIGCAPIFVSVLAGELGGPAMIGEALSIVCLTSSVVGAALFAVGVRGFPR
jgi:predicted MFS family arabinose efflux permease